MADTFRERGFIYMEIIDQLMAEGLLKTDMEILILCAGDFDKEVFERYGFTNVTISNLARNLKPDDFIPYAAKSLDAEAIDLPDNSYDWCVVHAGLHHCAVPQNAILEMFRVARVGCFACEPVDSLMSRLSMRFGFSQRYEIGSVIDKLDDKGGGLRFGGIPNWIHRFSRESVEQTIRTAHPEARHRFIMLHRLVVPWYRFRGKWTPKSILVKLLTPFLLLMQKSSLLANNIAFAVLKPKLPEDLHPWLKEADGELRVDAKWVEENWRHH
ncbi:MAG: methyltransferase domain-containing protein [Verrucomicrobiota bacterium]